MSVPSQAGSSVGVGPFPHTRTDTPKKRNATTGRYLYLGVVPRFQAQDLELYVSKMGLTLRVRAWVTPQLRDQYARLLLLRWKKIRDAFQDPVLRFEPLFTTEMLMERANTASDRAWLSAASPYMGGFLQEQGIDLSTLLELNDASQYRDGILLAQLRHYLGAPEANLQDGDRLVSALDEVETAGWDSFWSAFSRQLFDQHLGHLFTSVTQDPARSGYLGYLTLVYPIAATVDGPFGQPSEGLYHFGTLGSMLNARWWSNRWQDEFGGFPFLQLNRAGVAFHGPISNYEPMDIWYLRRGYVSHGCLRMDASDLLEFRALLPNRIANLPISESIPTWIMAYPDVTDWDRNGVPEVMDVEYYVSDSGMAEARKMDFWKKHFYGVSDGIPRYEVSQGRLVRNRVWRGLEIHSFPQRGNRIIQYRESDIQLRGFDDIAGKYPPSYFD